jgi:hypothetical protein
MIWTFVIAIIGFACFVGAIAAAQGLDDIKSEENWPLYRCNPTYMFLADNIAENFEYCLQQSSKSVFGKLSQSLSDLQGQGFDLQSITTGNIVSLMESMNFSNSSIGFSLTSMLDKSGAINVLMMSIMSVFTDILGKLGQIVASTGGMMNSGAAGISIVNNEFSKYLNMFK